MRLTEKKETMHGPQDLRKGLVARAAQVSTSLDRFADLSVLSVVFVRVGFSPSWLSSASAPPSMSGRRRRRLRVR